MVNHLVYNREGWRLLQPWAIYLEIPSGSLLTDPNRPFIGTAWLDLPKSGTVQININVGYDFQTDGEGHGSPTPSSLNYKYTIPLKN